MQLIQQLAKQPLQVAQSSKGSGLLDATKVVVQIWAGSYWPKQWPELARNMAKAIEGDGRPLYEKFMLTQPGLREGEAKDPSDYLTTAFIQCQDTAHPRFKTLDEKIALARQLAAASPAGELWWKWPIFRGVLHTMGEVRVAN